MELSPSLIYWITRCDSFHYVIGTGAVILGIASLIFAMLRLFLWAEEVDEYSIQSTSIKRGLKILIPAFMSFLFIYGFIPSTKEMIAIYVVPKIVNSENVQNIGNEFYEVAVDWLKEMKPASVKKNIKNLRN